MGPINCAPNPINADDTMSCSRTQHSALCAVLLEGLKPATPRLELKSNTTMNRPLRSSAVHVDLPLSLLRLISMIGLYQLRSHALTLNNSCVNTSSNLSV